MDEQNMEHRKMASVKLTRQWLEDAAADGSFWESRLPLCPYNETGVVSGASSQIESEPQTESKILGAVETLAELLGDPEFLPEAADVTNTLKRIYQEVEKRAKFMGSS